MARAIRITAANALRLRWEQHHADPGKWFWKRVQVGAEDQCWPWLGRVWTHRRGYGRLKFKGSMIGAHRMALTLSVGEPAEGMFACHHCDNPVCCNPKHLFWGTPLDNTRDCLAKGRRVPRARKINLDEAVKLRADGLSYSAIAERYGVNQSSVAMALKRAALRARKEM